jgi:hypothetical protein
VQSRPLDSYPKQPSRPLKSTIQKLPVAPTSHPRLYIGKKLKEISMKKRSYSTSKRTSSILRHTIGKTNTDRGNRDTSIGYILGMSGISIIRLIMSMSFRICCTFPGIFDANLSIISTDNPPPKVVQGYKVRFCEVRHVLRTYVLT